MGVNIPISPIEVNVLDISKPENVKVYGPALDAAVRNCPTYFIVDCKEAGPGGIEISITDEKGYDVQFTNLDHNDGRVEVSFTPITAGPTYKCQIFYSGVQISQSPINILIKCDLDLSLVEIENLRLYVYKDSFECFLVNVCKLPDYETIKVRAKVTNPSRKSIKCLLTKRESGIYQCKYSALDEGPHQIEVFCNDSAISAKPFHVQVVPGFDPTRVTVTGIGLQSGALDACREFIVDVEGAGQGGLGIAVEGPVKTEMTCTDNEDGTCLVKYYPVEEGNYKIYVKFHDKNIPGSPFNICLKSSIPGCNVKCSGPCLSKDILSDKETYLSIDTSDETEEFPLQVKILYLKSQIPIDYRMEKDESLHKVFFTPHAPEEINIHVFYGDNEIKQSPFHALVLPLFDVNKVTVFGDGVKPRLGFLYSSNEQKQFTIDVTKAGIVQVKVKIFLNKKRVHQELLSTDGKIFQCNYTTDVAGDYQILIFCNNVELPESPYMVNVIGDYTDPDNSVRNDVIPELDIQDDSLNERDIITETTYLLQSDKYKIDEPPNDNKLAINSHFEDFSIGKTTEEQNDTFTFDSDDISENSKCHDLQHLDNLTSSNSFSTDNVIQKNMETKTFDVQQKSELLIFNANFNGLQIPNHEKNYTSTDSKDIQNNERKELPKPGKDILLTAELEESAVNEIEPIEADLVETALIETDIVNLEMHTSVGSIITMNYENSGNDLFQDSRSNDRNHQEVQDIEKKPEEIEGDKNKIEPSTAFQVSVPEKNDILILNDESMLISERKYGDFNSEPIDESTENQVKQLTSPDYESSLKEDSNNRLIHLKFSVSNDSDNFAAKIQDESGRIINPDVSHVKEKNELHIYFCPNTFGNHTLSINCADRPLQRSPYNFIVDDSGIVPQLLASGAGLYSSLIYAWSDLFLDVRNVCQNGFSLCISGPGECHIHIFEKDENSLIVRYLPVVDGQYLIYIKYLGMDICGSPFSMQCLNRNVKVSSLKLETISELPIKPNARCIDKLRIVVVNPNRDKDIWHCLMCPNGNLGIAVQPKLSGKHLIYPFLGKKKLSSHPYVLNVEEHNLPKPENVLIKDYGKNTFMMAEEIQISFDTSNAGFGELDILIEGPEKIDIKSSHGGLECSSFSFSLNIPGIYVVTVCFGGLLIKGYPKVIWCVNGDEMIANSFEDFEVTKINTLKKDEDFEITYPLAGLGSSSNLRAKVISPSGKVQLCQVKDYDGKHFRVLFTPDEIGEHVVSIKSGKMHVTGSPFKLAVDSVEQVGPQNVQVYGAGIEGGFVNKDNEFSLFTQNAGTGKLTVSIDGPSKAAINLIDKGDGAYQVIYRMSLRGDYMCSIKFNNEHIPGSPFKLCLEDDIQDVPDGVQNVTLATIQNQGLTVGNKSSFTLHHLGLNKGILRAYAVTPSNKEKSVHIQSVGNDQFSVQFKPKESGMHHIHVLLDERPITGSPFSLMAGEIKVAGKGLTDGAVGETCYFTIDAQNATPGPLTVTVDGPSKVDLNCFEQEDCYEFSYVPLVAGEYFLTIKHGKNIHVKGSPFKVNVVDVNRQFAAQNMSQTDGARHDEPKSYPDKVKCRGEGISRAYFGRNNEFVVDASSGGSGVLYVGITGPTRPCEEVNIKHIGGKRFQINYFAQEYGGHTILIRWGDREIPGSPFHIYVQ